MAGMLRGARGQPPVDGVVNCAATHRAVATIHVTPSPPMPPTSLHLRPPPSSAYCIHIQFPAAPSPVQRLMPCFVMHHRPYALFFPPMPMHSPDLGGPALGRIRVPLWYGT